MCPICEDKRTSYCIRCRLKTYGERLKSYSRYEQEALEHYRNIIRGGIEAATRYDRFDSFDVFEDIKEAYSIELIEKWTPGILAESPPPPKTIFWKALSHTNIRKGSWYDILTRSWESFATLPKVYVFEYDQDGHIADFAFSESEWAPPINPPDPHKTDPEKFLLELETYLTVDSLPSVIGAMRRKHAREYQRILEMQLDGLEVRPKHAPELGIRTEDLTHLKHQMKRRAREIVAENDPDLEEKQKVYDAQRGQKWTIKKSTFKERKASYADNVRKNEPRTIRDWKVLNGGKASTKSAGHLVACAASFQESA